MLVLFPVAADGVDAYDACRPSDPWARALRLNFVTSVDGSITDEQGRSGGLGGEGDRAMFRALRAWADAILVGASTVRIEGYRPHRLSPSLAAQRAADGRPQPAAIVVVSRSLDLDTSAPLFTEAKTPTIVLTCAAAPEDRQRAMRRAGRVLVAGENEVDLAAGLDQLAAEGLVSVLSEGGARLASGLFEASLVDELFLTLAPMLIGRIGPGLVAELPARVTLELSSVLTDGAELLLRYTCQNRRSSGLSSPRSAS